MDRNFAWQVIKNVVFSTKFAQNLMVNHFSLVRSLQVDRPLKLLWSYRVFQVALTVASVKLLFLSVPGNGRMECSEDSGHKLWLYDHPGCLVLWKRPTKLMMALISFHSIVCYHRLMSMPLRPYETITLHPNRMEHFPLCSVRKEKRIASKVQRKSIQFLQALLPFLICSNLWAFFLFYKMVMVAFGQLGPMEEVLASPFGECLRTIVLLGDFMLVILVIYATCYIYCVGANMVCMTVYMIRVQFEQLYSRIHPRRGVFPLNIYKKHHLTLLKYVFDYSDDANLLFTLFIVLHSPLAAFLVAELVELERENSLEIKFAPLVLIADIALMSYAYLCIVLFHALMGTVPKLIHGCVPHLYRINFRLVRCDRMTRFRLAHHLMAFNVKRKYGTRYWPNYGLITLFACTKFMLLNAEIIMFALKRKMANI